MEISESRRQRPLISLTPLIDVVFILLVFFMLASSFVKWQFIDIAVGEAETLPLDIQQQSLVGVNFNGAYELNNKPLTLDAIVSEIKQQLDRQPDHPVLVKPANDLPLQQLLVVLDALGAVAGPNLSLASDQE